MVTKNRNQFNARLLLPLIQDRKQAWGDFEEGIKAHGFVLRVTGKRHGELLVVEVNTTTDEEDEVVLGIMNLCFSSCHEA